MGLPPPSSRRGFPQVLEAKGIGHNSFQKFDRMKSAVDRFVVTPNNFTIDGYAIVDLADGPVVIHVPKLADDRSFIVQVGTSCDITIDSLTQGPIRLHRRGSLIDSRDFARLLSDETRHVTGAELKVDAE